MKTTSNVLCYFYILLGLLVVSAFFYETGPHDADGAREHQLRCHLLFAICLGCSTAYSCSYIYIYIYIYIPGSSHDVRRDRFRARGRRCACFASR